MLFMSMGLAAAQFVEHVPRKDRMSHFQVPPEAAHFSLKIHNVAVLGELHCIALRVSWSEYFMFFM